MIGLSGRLQAREIVRRQTDNDGLQRSTQLAGLVPRGANYTFDVIAYVGLEDLLAGRPVDASFATTLGREVLLAFHYWILDYRSDGRRRGYPFDPYTLYLHRRLVRGARRWTGCWPTPPCNARLPMCCVTSDNF